MPRAAFAAAACWLVVVGCLCVVAEAKTDSKYHGSKPAPSEEQPEPEVWLLHLHDDAVSSGSDERVGGTTWATSMLSDFNGNKVGSAVWTGTIYAEGRANWQGKLSLTDGHLVMTGSGPADGGGRDTYVVVGGSGAYTGVSGFGTYRDTVNPPQWTITLTMP